MREKLNSQQNKAKGQLKLPQENTVQGYDEIRESERRISDLELGVCDIIGDWGCYQWSLAMFALICSALLGSTVMVGPIWTPDMNHVCFDETTRQTQVKSETNQAIMFQQCIVANQSHECKSFIYDDENYGKVLTNSFDLVCGRKWHRSFLSSSALTGLLLSSVTLGLVSDRYGRLVCIKSGFVISILATAGAILVGDYFLLNVCLMLMTFAQAGIANALSTLVMESTSPKWHFASLFGFGFGWALGMLIIPILMRLTMNYRLYLATLLMLQLILLVWLKFGVFESIRWLLSEGQINRAQIELQRACRMNNIQNGTQLAQKIAQVQVQQARKASSVLEHKLAPEWLAQAKKQDPCECAKELSQLRAVVRRSFSSNYVTAAAATNNASRLSGVELSPDVCWSQTTSQESLGPTMKLDSVVSHSGRYLDLCPASIEPTKLSPTLAKKSFSCQDLLRLSPPDSHRLTAQLSRSNHSSLSRVIDREQSITSQGLIQLALDYSNTVQRHVEGSCFILKLFHRKLYKLTLVLVLLDLLLQTIYFGLIETNKFVGTSISENYLIGALFDSLACLIYLPVLWLFSRRNAIIWPTLISALICIALAMNYHLIPDEQVMTFSARQSRFEEDDTNGNLSVEYLNVSAGHRALPQLGLLAKQKQQQQLVQFRETLNLLLVPSGRMATAVSKWIVTTIAMESYPNNLRQTAPSIIRLVGRIGSILAPFLFNDTTEDKWILQTTLLTLGVTGFIACLLVPLVVTGTKHVDLIDRLNEI